MELAFTPAGRITLSRFRSDSDAIDADATDSSSGESTKGDPRLHRLAEAFVAGQDEGLVLLAAERWDGSLSPAVAYWRDFATRYLTDLCHVPDVGDGKTEPLPPPNSTELATWILNTPPMQGAEYISAETLTGVWQSLDKWVHNEISEGGDGLAGFLKRRLPLWHQVGRVCFHLAENRRNEERPFAFLATYAPGLTGGSRGTRVQYQPLSTALREFAGAKNKGALVRLLSPVQQASEHSGLVKELVESGDIYHPLSWTPREAYRFLSDVPILEKSGVLVRMPDWWKKRPRPRVEVKIGDAGKKKFDSSGMLDFQVNLALGDQTLTKQELQQLLADENGLMMLRGQWVEVDRDKLKQALDHWKVAQSQAEDGVSFIEGMRMLAGVPADLATDSNGLSEDRSWAFVTAGKWLGEILTKMRSPDNLPPLAANGDLKATLRHYQEAGVRWLQFLSSLGLGACLADDMGLGKTLQVITLLLGLRKEGKPSLLVLPASLLANWRAEINRFAPSLKALFVHPAEMSKQEVEKIAADPAKALQGIDVAVTSYGMLQRQEWLVAHSWKLVVLDEAQAIKNPASRQTRIVKQLKADARIALTGTPIENRLSDLWSLFDFLCPGLLGSTTKFKAFVKQLNARETQRYAPLRSLVQPYILRRLKTDKRVIDDLPEKVEVQAFCGLSKRQAAMYAKMVDELKELLEESTEGIKRRGLVLSYLMRFKQLCNHPSQVLRDGRYAPDDSGKFARLAEIGEEIASRQERALVFTQFREMTDPLAKFLAEVFGRPGLVLHGETAVKRRQALVNEFQKDDGPPFFVLSLKAGGTGLNLTAASHVIHFDRWWNPAVENQATDRAFRIGQKRSVLVHKFVCRGTIEERIDALIADKRQLADDLLEGGAERMLTEMTDAELIRFVALDIAKTNT